jgi:hypothetical protein
MNMSMLNAVRRVPRVVCSLLAVAAASGCGFQTPSLEPLAGSQQEVAFAVNNIANHVKCEIYTALQDAKVRYASSWDKIKWIETWAAKVTLKIQVEEKTSFAPGISFNTIFPNGTTTFGTQTITTAQTFSFGIGGQFSTDATRIEQLGFFLQFDRLPKEPVKCPVGQGPHIEGDLKFGEWLNTALFLDLTPGTLFPIHGAAAGDPSQLPYDVISHEVQFVIIAGANVTPTWKLVAVTANPTGPLLGATRTRTDDVLITIGPTVDDLKGGKGAKGPSTAVENSHLASQISSGIRNALP